MQSNNYQDGFKALINSFQHVDSKNVYVSEYTSINKSLFLFFDSIVFPNYPIVDGLDEKLYNTKNLFQKNLNKREITRRIEPISNFPTSFKANVTLEDLS